MQLFIKTCIFTLGFLVSSTVIFAERADEQNKSSPQTLENYNQAIRLNPNNAWAYNNRGASYYSLNNNNSACDDWRKACELGDCDILNWAKQKGICQ